MKVAILGSSGHWRLVIDGLSQILELSPKSKGMIPILEWSVAPIVESHAGPVEDMAPVLSALNSVLAAQEISLPSPKFFSSWLELLDQVKPEIAVVNPPFYLLGTVIKECLTRGIHVFAEKPIAISRLELSEIHTVSRLAKSPRFMAMLTMRYESVFVAAEKFISEGHLGKPVMLQAQKSYPIMGWDGKPRPAFYHKRSTYGGTIPWIGIHVLDLFRWFTKSEFAQVSAQHSTLANQGHGEMESAATIDIVLKSGTLASAQLDFLQPRNSWTETDSNRKSWGDDRLRLVCEQGQLEICGGQITIHKQGERENNLNGPPVTGMFHDFLDWIAHDKPMRLTSEDCFAAAEAALLARDAADHGRILNF